MLKYGQISGTAGAQLCSHIRYKMCHQTVLGGGNRLKRATQEAIQALLCVLTDVKAGILKQSCIKNKGEEYTMLFRKAF